MAHLLCADLGKIFLIIIDTNEGVFWLNIVLNFEVTFLVPVDHSGNGSEIVYVASYEVKSLFVENDYSWEVDLWEELVLNVIKDTVLIWVLNVFEEVWNDFSVILSEVVFRESQLLITVRIELFLSKKLSEVLKGLSVNIVDEVEEGDWFGLAVVETVGVLALLGPVWPPIAVKNALKIIHFIILFYNI